MAATNKTTPAMDAAPEKRLARLAPAVTVEVPAAPVPVLVLLEGALVEVALVVASVGG
jgi:hypothetical protein